MTGSTCIRHTGFPSGLRPAPDGRRRGDGKSVGDAAIL